MQTRQFHLGDVLSVLTDRTVSPNGISGIVAVIRFVTGSTDQEVSVPMLRVGKIERILSANKTCKIVLGVQFPQIVTGMDVAIAKLDDALVVGLAEAEKVAREKIMATWLAEQVAKYGEMLSVGSLSE